MAGRLTMATARAFLERRNPDAQVTVEPFEAGGWVVGFTLPNGERWNEAINPGDIAMASTEDMLRVLDNRVSARLRGYTREYMNPWVSPTDDTADAVAYGTFRGVDRTPEDRLSGVRFGMDEMERAMRRMDSYRVSAMDYGVGSFTRNDPISYQPLQTPGERLGLAEARATTARIAAMSFEEYVAELHAALDPRGAGL